MAAAAVPTAVLDGAVLMHTDKTMIDHVVSATSGQDCSTLRAQKGGHYCRPIYENQPTVAAVYCYRTLAAVTCYDRPSVNPGDKLVGLQPAGRLSTW